MSIVYMNWEEKAREQFAELFRRKDDAEEGEILARIPPKPQDPERRQFRAEKPTNPQSTTKPRKGWLYREIRRSRA